MVVPEFFSKTIVAFQEIYFTTYICGETCSDIMSTFSFIRSAADVIIEALLFLCNFLYLHTTFIHVVCLFCLYSIPPSAFVVTSMTRMVQPKKVSAI